jgi:hypothetical protein
MEPTEEGHNEVAQMDYSANTYSKQNDQDFDNLLDQLTQNIAKVSISPAKTPPKFTGSHPNVQWKAIPLETLHNHARFIHTEEIIPQRSDEWYKLRKGRLTGSQFANALGFFDHSSCKKLNLKPKKTYHHPERVFLVYNGILEFFPVIEGDEDFSSAQRVFMDWGVHHETNALITYLDEFVDRNVKETTFHIVDDLEAYIRRHCNMDDFAFVTDFSLIRIGASPDGIVVKDGQDDSVLEIKCPTDFRYMKRKPHDTVPVYYIPQLMGEMMVTNLPKCTFCSWTITAGMNVFEVMFDQAYVNEMLYWFYRYVYHIKSVSPISIDNLGIFEGIFMTEERYEKFLQWSMNIAESAVLLKTIEKSATSKEHPNIFLD